MIGVSKVFSLCHLCARFLFVQCPSCGGFSELMGYSCALVSSQQKKGRHNPGVIDASAAEALGISDVCGNFCGSLTISDAELQTNVFVFFGIEGKVSCNT